MPRTLPKSFALPAARAPRAWTDFVLLTFVFAGPMTATYFMLCKPLLNAWTQ